jgi:hypothetical protein
LYSRSLFFFRIFKGVLSWSDERLRARAVLGAIDDLAVSLLAVGGWVVADSFRAVTERKKRHARTHPLFARRRMA